MAIPDVNSLTITELKELISVVANEIADRENDQAVSDQNARQAIIQARAELEALLGPVGAAPGTTSIRSVLAFGDVVIAQNSAQAVPLIVHALAALTKTMIDLTKIVKTN